MTFIRKIFAMITVAMFTWIAYISWTDMMSGTLNQTRTGLLTKYKVSKSVLLSSHQPLKTLSSRNVTIEDLNGILAKECNGSYVDHSSLSVIVSDGSPPLPFEDYKRWQADDFIKRHANPGKKSATPTKLRKYTVAERPNPKTLLKNWAEQINVGEIEEDVENARQARLKLGDDDILQIPEVQHEISNSFYKVPNLIHFVWFGCNRMRVDHYITILGALRYQNPRLILIHGDCAPNGEYWDRLKRQGGNKIRLIRRTPPEDIWGIKIKVIEHRADVARLQLMLEVGGIYLDTDSAILRNVDELRNYTMLLSESNYNSLANGIIFANRKAWFLRRWYHEYKYFKDSAWGHNSVIVPWALWRLFPDKIQVVKELICRPNWEELPLIYHELYDWHKNYIMHLYSRFLKKMDGTEEHTLKELAILNTTYGQIARHILWGDEKPRDITDWLFSCNQTQGLTEFVAT